MYRKYSKVLTKRVRPNSPTKYGICCYVQKLEIPFPFLPLIAETFGDTCKINFYTVGTRTKEIYRVYSKDGHRKEFTRFGDLVDFMVK